MIKKLLLIIFLVLSVVIFPKVLNADGNKQLPKNSIVVGPYKFYFNKSDIYRPGVIQASVVRQVTPCVIILREVYTEKGDSLKLARLLQNGIIVLPKDVILEDKTFNPMEYSYFVIRGNNVDRVTKAKNIVIILNEL